MSFLYEYECLRKLIYAYVKDVNFNNYFAISFYIINVIKVTWHDVKDKNRCGCDEV